MWLREEALVMVQLIGRDSHKAPWRHHSCMRRRAVRAGAGARSKRAGAVTAFGTARAGCRGWQLQWCNGLPQHDACMQLQLNSARTMLHVHSFAMAGRAPTGASSTYCDAGSNACGMWWRRHLVVAAPHLSGGPPTHTYTRFCFILYQ